MTYEQSTTAATPRLRPPRRFVLHYLEMLAAMGLGMLLLHPVWSIALDTFGASAVLDRPDLAALVMATNMTLGMSAWMRFRRHSWAPIAEMAVAMYAPFVILFVPLWAGAISGEALMMTGHMLMLPAMLVAMLHRRDEYTRPHPKHT